MRLIDILSIFWVAIWLLPQARAWLGAYNAVWAACFGLWLIYVPFSHRATQNSKGFYFAIVIYLALVFLLTTLKNADSMFNRYLELTQVPFTFILAQYYINRKNSWDLKLLLLILPLLLWPSVVTAQKLVANPFISRAINMTGEDSLMLMREGIGGYGLIYAALIFAVVLFYFGYHERRIHRKWLCYGCTLVFSTLVVLSNFFTATIMLFIGLIGTFVLKSKKNIPLLIILGLFTVFTYRPLLEMIISGATHIVQQDGRTYDRLMQMRQSLKFNNATDNVDTRSDVNKLTLKMIAEHPVQGKFFSNDMSRENSDLDGIGQHSTIMDTFAIWGIPLGLFFIFLLIYPFRVMWKLANGFKAKTFVVIGGGVFFGTILTNNMTPSMGLGAYFLLPVLLNLFVKQNC